VSQSNIDKDTHFRGITAETNLFTKFNTSAKAASKSSTSCTIAACERIRYYEGSAGKNIRRALTASFQCAAMSILEPSITRKKSDAERRSVRARRVI
jgi:hypothetical protein